MDKKMLAGTYRCWILWNAFSCGTGTKTTYAFLPPLTSTSLAELICSGRSSDRSSGTFVSRSTSACAIVSSVLSGDVVGALAVRTILFAAAAADVVDMVIVVFLLLFLACTSRLQPNGNFPPRCDFAPGKLHSRILVLGLRLSRDF